MAKGASCGFQIPEPSSFPAILSQVENLLVYSLHQPYTIYDDRTVSVQKVVMESNEKGRVIPLVSISVSERCSTKSHLPRRMRVGAKVYSFRNLNYSPDACISSFHFGPMVL